MLNIDSVKIEEIMNILIYIYIKNNINYINFYFI